MILKEHNQSSFYFFCRFHLKYVSLRQIHMSFQFLDFLNYIWEHYFTISGRVSCTLYHDGVFY